MAADERVYGRHPVLELLRSSEHARVIVYDGHPDNIAGVLYAKDMLNALDRRLRNQNRRS